MRNISNLILDDFDNDMQLAGFKLIRYADDFVVLCKSKQRAEQAHDAAVFSLQAHGLALNAEKTNITTMERDFHITRQGACYLNREARNLYLSKLMEKFDAPIKAKDEIEAKTLFEHLHQQNLSLIA